MVRKLSRHAFSRYFGLHAWAGVLGGLVLYVMFVAGALTLFHEPLEAWEEPLAQRPAEEPRGFQAALDRSLAATGSVPDELWLFPPRGDRGEPRIAYLEDGEWRSPWVDRERGLVHERERLAHFTYALHYLWHDVTGRWLYTAAGILAVLFLLVLVTGVLVHVKDLARQLHQFRVERSRRVLWSDMHKVLGVMGLPFQLAYAYTGAFLVLSPLLLGLLVDPATAGGNGGEEARPPASAAAPGLSLDELARRAVAARPDLAPAYFRLSHHGRPDAVVEVWGSTRATPSDPIAVRVRARDGEIIDGANAREGAAAAMRRWIRGLHFARFGGLPLRFVFFALALAACATILTGNWVWLSRRAPSRGNEVLRRLTAGVGAGTWVALAALFLASRLYPLDWSGRGAAEELTFLGVLAACIGWALAARDAGALWWRQLALAGALLAPVPLLAARVSSAGLFGAGRRLPEVVAVDVALLILAAALLAGAWALRRARLGAPPRSSAAGLAPSGGHDA